MLTRRLKYVFDKLFPSLKSRTVNKYDTKHSRSAIKYTLQHEMMAKKTWENSIIADTIGKLYMMKGKKNKIKDSKIS